MFPLPPAFRSGAVAMAPLAFAAIPFGMIFGSGAVRAGLTWAEALLMSLTVFAGGSQFLAIGLWADPVPWLGITFAVLLVNLRHTLMAASLTGKMHAFQGSRRWLAAFLLADETWALAEKRARETALTPIYYFGAGLTLYLAWASGSLIGALAGGLVTDPARFGLDFAFPAIFICVVMGFATSWRAAPVVVVSAIAALLAEHFLGGTWFVIIGGLAGITVAALLPEDGDA